MLISVCSAQEPHHQHSAELLTNKSLRQTNLHQYLVWSPHSTESEINKIIQNIMTEEKIIIQLQKLSKHDSFNNTKQTHYL